MTWALPIAWALVVLGWQARDAFRAWLRARYADESLRREVEAFRSELLARVGERDKALNALKEQVGSLEFRVGGGG